MTDDMLRALAKNGGVCMINFFAAFLNDDVAQVIMKAQREKKKSAFRFWMLVLTLIMTAAIVTVAIVRHGIGG